MQKKHLAQMMQSNYIRSIEQVQKAKKKICLGNGADFILYNKEVKRFGLEEDMEISEDLYERLMTEIFVPRAKKRAMFLLEKMDRSESQLRGKLRDNGYPEEAIDAAIEYVKSFHYLDDERMARSYIRFYQESRSKMRVKQDLMKKGINRDLIDYCIEEEYQNSQIDLIKVLLEKKHYDRDNATREETAKMYRFLMGRGFSSNDISKAIRFEEDY